MVKIKHLLVLCLWIQLSQALFFDLFKPKSVKRHYTRPSRTYFRPKSVSRPTSVARSGQWTPITKTTYKNQSSYKSNSRSTTTTYTSKNTYTPTKTYTYPSSTYTTYTSNSHGTYSPSSTSYTYINYPYKTISRRPVSRRIVNKQLIKVNKVIPTMTFNDPKTKVMDTKKTPETNIENDAPNRINIDDLLSIGLPFEGTEVDQDQTPKEAEVSEDIIDILASKPNLQTLFKQIQDSGLTETLKNLPQVTIFAPSNQALENENNLDENDLKRHVILVAIPSTNIETGPAVALSQDVLNLTKSLDGKVQVGFEDISANVIEADIKAKNGVIHVIDEVLRPFSIEDAIDLRTDEI